MTSESPFPSAPTVQAAPAVDPAVLAAILAAVTAQSAAPAVVVPPASAAPKFHVDKETESLIISHNLASPRGNSSSNGLQTFDFRVGQQLIFGTSAKLEVVRTDEQGNESAFNKIGNEALLYVPAIKLISVTYSQQAHAEFNAEGEPNPKFGQKFNVLRWQIALPGVQIGYKSAEGNKLIQFDIFRNSPSIEDEADTPVRSLLVNGVTSGVMQKTVDMVKTNCLAMGWTERADRRTDKGTKVWKLEPNTGTPDNKSEDDVAHYRAILARGFGKDIAHFQLRQSRDSSKDPFMDPMTGILDAYHKDAHDLDLIHKNNIDLQDKNIPIVRGLGAGSRALTGSAYLSTTGEPDALAGRTTKYADLMQLEFVDGKLAFWENNLQENSFGTPAPVAPAVNWKMT